MCTRSASLSNPATDLGKEGRDRFSRDRGNTQQSGKHSRLLLENPVSENRIISAPGDLQNTATGGPGIVSALRNCRLQWSQHESQSGVSQVIWKPHNRVHNDAGLNGPPASLRTFQGVSLCPIYLSSVSFVLTFSPYPELEMEPRTLHVLGRPSTTELHG
jgi:hypothetical protein